MKNKMRTRVHTIGLFSALLLLTGCSDKQNSQATYSLVATDKRISFNVGPDLADATYLSSVYIYTDDNGKEYLTFQNIGEPEIYIYGVNDGELYRKYTFEPEGNNGVGSLGGYLMKSPNEIYMMSTSLREIIQTDGNKITKRMRYIDMPRLHDDMPLPTMGYAWTFVQEEMFFIGDSLYIAQSLNHEYDNPAMQSPVKIIIDTAKREIQPFNFTYSIDISAADYFARNSNGFSFNLSHFFDGKNILLSFADREEIYVTDVSGTLIRTVPAKSRYINNVKTFRPSKDFASMPEFLKYECEHPFYGSIIYDKYREVYYRIAYPPTEMENDVNYLDAWRFGRKEFSVIIMDKEFNIIGETVFKDYSYSSRMLLVTKEGLYAYDNVFIKPDYNEDALSFRLLKLEKDSF
jgi:hypothetical protein